MKAFYYFFILIALGACKAKTEPTSQNLNKTMKTECPKDGDCTTELQESKLLLIKKEEATGYLYPEITEGNNLVILFNYNKKAPEGIADGNHSETIHFEIPKEFNNLNKKDEELADVKLLYGKHCFCEDAGYYKVLNGELSVIKQDSKISFELSFKLDDIDSEIHHIKETVALN